jgi:hypothetical protein
MKKISCILLIIIFNAIFPCKGDFSIQYKVPTKCFFGLESNVSPITQTINTDTPAQSHDSQTKKRIKGTSNEFSGILPGSKPDFLSTDEKLLFASNISVSFYQCFSNGKRGPPSTPTYIL